MGDRVLLYGAVALLLVASTGPVLASVRDHSLMDMAALDEPKTLNDFPFLKAVEPYLPDLVIDWLVIRVDDDLDLPDDVNYRVDRDGRVILVWPDGCEETQDEFRSGSLCAPPPGPDCRANPGADGCPGAKETECPAGFVARDAFCVADPACLDARNETQADACPTDDEEEAEETPPCSAGEVLATNGTCLPVATHELRRTTFVGTESADRRLDVSLIAPYENLSLEITFAGLPAPQWKVKLFHKATGENVCWVPVTGGNQAVCEPTPPGPIQTGHRSYIDDGTAAPIPAGQYTLLVEYEGGPGTSKSLEVRLFGKPAENDAG